jgi:hypothetical protein
MIEAVTVVFVMTVILPVLIIMVTSALNTREVSTSLMANSINTTGAQTSLNNDIETASAIKIVDGNLLNLRSQAGSCKAWKIQDGNLVRAESDTAITSDSSWLTIGEHFAPIESTDLFQKDSAGNVEYNFKVGKAAVIGELRGSASQKSASSGAGDCW